MGELEKVRTGEMSLRKRLVYDIDATISPCLLSCCPLITVQVRMIDVDVNTGKRERFGT